MTVFYPPDFFNVKCVMCDILCELCNFMCAFTLISGFLKGIMWDVWCVVCDKWNVILNVMTVLFSPYVQILKYYEVCGVMHDIWGVNVMCNV